MLSPDQETITYADNNLNEEGYGIIYGALR